MAARHHKADWKLPIHNMLSSPPTQRITRGVNNIFIILLMVAIVGVLMMRVDVVQSKRYELAQPQQLSADDGSEMFVKVSSVDYERWMMHQPNIEKIYRLSKRTRKVKTEIDYKTEYLYVLGEDHTDGPSFYMDASEEIIPKHANISIVFDYLDEALEYVHENKDDPYAHRFVIIMQQGIHKVQGNEARISRPFTSIVSEDPRFPDRTIIRANDINGQVLFIDSTHNITIKGVTLTGGHLVNLRFSHKNVPKPCGSGLLISSSSNILVESVLMQANKAAIGGSVCVHNSTIVNFHKCFIKNSVSFIRNMLLTDSLNGLQFSEASNFNVNNSIFAQNLPASNDPEGVYGCGGGLAIFNSHNTIFSSCVFANNTAINGGAIFTVNSSFNITNSRISGNTAYNQSSGIYSDWNSEVSIEKVFFLENRCVRLTCKIIYSPKKEYLDDISSFKEVVFPAICITGIILSSVLAFIAFFEFMRMVKQRRQWRNVVWGDKIYLWLLGSLGIYRPYRSVPRPYNWFHRALIVVILVLSCILQGMQSAAVMPEFFDQMDTVRFTISAIQQVVFNFIPLVCYIALILAVKASYKRLFVNYKPPIPTEVEVQEENASLINFYQTQIDKENESVNTASPVSELSEQSFRKKKRKHAFDWKKDTQKTGLQRSIHNRRALAGVLISVLILASSYIIIIFDTIYFIDSNIDIAATTNQPIGLDTISSAVFYMMHWLLNMSIMTMVLLTVFLLCNRINSYQNTFFETLYHQLERAVFNLQTGVYSYVHLRKECKRLVRYSWILTISYIIIFSGMCVNQVLMVLWGGSEFKFFIYYIAVLVVMLVLITHVSYTSNHWTSFRFDDFLAAVPHSITYDYGIFFVPGANKKLSLPKTEINDNLKLNDTAFPAGESKDKAEQLLRDLTFFHMYIRDRTFAYRFPLEIQMQTYVVLTAIGLLGSSYALLKYVSNSFETSYYYQYL